MMDNLTWEFFNCLTEYSRHIREEVFVKEQHFKEEFDLIDNEATHIVLFLNNVPIGTGRFFIENDEHRVGRVAILKNYRNKGYGSIILKELENKIRTLGGNKIVLSSQKQAIGFYKKLDYIETGDFYLEEHCPHIKMINVLN